MKSTAKLGMILVLSAFIMGAFLLFQPGAQSETPIKTQSQPLAVYEIVSPNIERTCTGKTCTAIIHSSPKWVYDEGRWKNFTDVVNMSFSSGDIIFSYKDQYNATMRVLFAVNVSQTTCSNFGWTWVPEWSLCRLSSLKAKQFMADNGINYRTLITKHPSYYKYGLNFTGIPAQYQDKLVYVILYLENANGMTWSDVKLVDKSVVIKDAVKLSFNDLLDSGYTLQLYDKRTVLIGNISGKGELWLDPTVQLQSNETDNLEDTYITDGAADTNYGTITYLYTGSDTNSYNYSTFIKFNLSAIPSGSTIDDSSLSLYEYSGCTVSNTSIYNVSNQTWNEDSVTWNNNPGNGSLIDTIEVGGVTGNWYTWNVTSWVSSEFQNNNMNASFKLTENAFDNNACVFYSKEYTTDISLRPYLNITYTPNSIPTIDTEFITPSAPDINENLILNATCSDADAGDTLTAYWRWYMNDTLNLTTKSKTVTNGTDTTLETLQSGNTSLGDKWTAEVWCGDGYANTSKENVSVIIGYAKILESDKIIADIYAQDGTVGYNFSIQIKWDITSIQGTLYESKLCFYTFDTSGTIDDDVTVYRVDNQTWTESITAGEYDAFTLTNQTSDSFNATPAVGVLVCVNVTKMVSDDYNANNSYATIRLEDADYIYDGTTQSITANNYLFFGGNTTNWAKFDNKTLSNPPTLRIVQSVANADPTLDAKSITPASPLTNDTLELSVTCADADSGDTLTAYWQWYNDSVSQTTLTGEATVTNGTSTNVGNITSGNTTKGEVWLAEVWCGDGTVNTSKSNTSSVTIGNTAPVVSAATLYPTTAYTTDDLQCELTVTDLDADSLTIDLTWYKDGVNQTALFQSGLSITNGTATNFTLASGNTTKNENWKCGARVTDGTATSDWTNSSAVTISNSAPTLGAITLYPSTAYTTNDLLGETSCADNDASETLTVWWEWYKNNVSAGENGSLTVTNGTATNVTTLASGNTSRGEEWIAEFWCGDGTANTSRTNSTILTISNSLPVVTLISPADGSNISDSTPAFTFNITDADAGEVLQAEVFVNGTGNGTDSSVANGTQTTINGNTTLANVVNGVWTWYINASDNLTTVQSSIWAFSLDATPVTYRDLTYSSSVNEGVTNVIDINVTDSGGNLKTVTIDIDGANHSMTNTAGDIYEYNFSKAVVATETFTFTIWMNDTHGNENHTATQSFTVVETTTEIQGGGGASVGPPTIEISPSAPECANFTVHPRIGVSGEHEPGKIIKPFKIHIYNGNQTQLFEGVFSAELRDYCTILYAPENETPAYGYTYFEFQCVAPNSSVTGNFIVAAGNCSVGVKVSIGPTTEIWGDLSYAVTSFAMGQSEEGIAALVRFLLGSATFSVFGYTVAVPVGLMIFIFAVLTFWLAGLAFSRGG
jgi:hypothetical protein